MYGTLTAYTISKNSFTQTLRNGDAALWAKKKLKKAHYVQWEIFPKTDPYNNIDTFIGFEQSTTGNL